MRLIVRTDGTGSELDLHDVDIIVSINDLPCRAINADSLPISGYLVGQVYRSLNVQGRLYTLKQWEGIAYAAWLDRHLRRGMYGDTIPDVGESWTARDGGVAISWPDWMFASWERDLMAANALLNGHAS